MNLIFIDAKTNSSKPFAKIQRSGVLSFNKPADNIVNFATHPYFKIAVQEDSHCLFLVPTNDSHNALEPKNVKGGFWQLYLTKVFRNLSIDPKAINFGYEVSEVNNDGQTIYKLTRATV